MNFKKKFINKYYVEARIYARIIKLFIERKSDSCASIISITKFEFDINIFDEINVKSNYFRF